MKEKIKNITKIAGIISLAIGIPSSIALMTWGIGFLFISFILSPKREKIPNYFIFFGFFILTYIISSFFSPHSLRAVKSIIDDYWYFILFLSVYYTFTEKDEKLFTKILSFSFLIIAVYSIFQSFFGLNLYRHVLEQKFSIKGHPIYMAIGFFTDHLTFGGQIMMLTLILRKNLKLFTLGMLSLFLSFAFSSWLGFFFSLFIYFTLIKKKYFGFLLLLPLISLFFTPYTKKQLNEKLSGRTAIWRVGIDLFKKNPVKGIGENNYTEIFDKFYKKDFPFSPLGARCHLHNQYLQILVSSGPIPLVFFIIFLYFLIKNNYKSYYFLPFLSIIIASFFQNYITDGEIATLFWTNIAVMLKSKWKNS